MDCNSYSYTAPGLGVDTPHTWTPCNIVTIERKTSKGHDYFTISTGDGYNIAHDIDSAIRTATDWIRNGV